MLTGTGMYNGRSVGGIRTQMIPKSQKTEQFKKGCLDDLEIIGRNQFNENVKLIENYEMVKGKFIFNHYFGQEEYVDLIGQLTKEFELPSYLRHYDIVSQVINTLSGEWQERPDLFRVKGKGEEVTNEYIRKQTELLSKYVSSKIQVEVTKKLMEQGLDPERQDFNSEEEQQQYQQAVQQSQEQLTPPQIQEFMNSDWFTAAEIWGQDELEDARKKYRLAEKEKKEFEDMLIADRCFRHYYITPNGYNQETWNPVNVFFHKSPDIEYVEDGDYVGRIFYLTISDIIDRYGFRMTKSQLELLRDEDYRIREGRKDGVSNGYTYQQYSIPWRDYGDYKLLSDVGANRGFSDTYISPNHNIPLVDNRYLSSLGKRDYGLGNFCVIEGYWKSQKQIGKVTYIDEETGLLTVTLVDEDFIVPKDFTVISGTFEDSQDPNTVVWTWVNEIREGVKIVINNYNPDNKDKENSIYLGGDPLEFQFKGDINPYFCKLPVCGQVFTSRNSQSMSVVDLMKPHQIGYNVAMNQAYAEMQIDYGKFMIWDVNLFPDAKDWGGEESMNKAMLMAKNLKAAVVDTSPQNTQGATGATGGQYPREIDLDASSRILSRLQIAQTFEQMALKQIGFNEYRLGQQGVSSSATGIKEGQARSFSQTESKFTDFSNYVQRCHKMNLDIAQYVQSQQKDVTVSYIKSDLSRAFIKLNATNLLLTDLHVFVSNSQEELRQIEILRQLAIQNNTSGATMLDLAEVITLNSTAAIKAKLKVSQEKQEANLNRQYELQQQQVQQQSEIAQLKEEKEDARNRDNNKTKETVAYIQAMSKNSTQDFDQDNVPDIFEYDKLSLQQAANSSKEQLNREKLNIERDKAISDREIQVQKLELERRKLEQERLLEAQNLAQTRILVGERNKKNK